MERHGREQLKRIEEANFEVAQGEPDPRGWTVFVGHNLMFGTVDDLIIDTAAMKVRYLEVRRQGVKGREHIYIPVEQVHFDVDTACVLVRRDLGAVYEAMGTARPLAMPEAPPEWPPLTRVEDALRAAEDAVAADEGTHLDRKAARNGEPPSAR